MKNSPWWTLNSNKDLIETFVFIDFETTGLFSENSADPQSKRWTPGDHTREQDKLLYNFHVLNDSKLVTAPRITEFSFVSISRKTFINGFENMNGKHVLANEDFNDQQIYENISVQVPINVHTRQLNPNLNDVEWSEYEKRVCDNPTKFYLTKEVLITKNLFKTEWINVFNFLNNVKKPACLIAYNGLRFDFRILLIELQRYNLVEKFPIPNEVYFLDAYLSFLDIEKNHHEHVLQITNSINWKKVTKLVLSASENKLIKLNNDFTPEKCNIQIENTNTQVPFITNNEFLSKSSIVLKQLIKNDHHTPIKRKKYDDFFIEKQLSFSEPSYKLSSNSYLSIFESAHPLQFLQNAQWSPAKKRRMRKNLFHRKNTGDWYFNEKSSFDFFIEKGNFTLNKLHNQIIGCTYEAHKAQNDCEATLQVCMAYGNDFLSYLDKQYAKFPINFYSKLNLNNAYKQNSIN